MENILFWFFWWATLGICLWKIAEGFSRPNRMLEWPFLASSMWFYFYVYMAYGVKMGQPEYLPKDSFGLGQLMPLLCLIGIISGWASGLRGMRAQSDTKALYPLHSVWMAGLILMLIGIAGNHSVNRAVASGNLDFSKTSAYWYGLFYVGYPGLALSVWALSKMPGRRRWLLWLMTASALIVLLLPYLVNARRGPTFPAIFILLLVPPLAKKQPPKPVLFFGGLVLAGLLMLVFYNIRTNLYKEGGTWSEAMPQLNVQDAVESRNQGLYDNEYINNCWIIYTLSQNNKFQYGTGHLELLVHWIPRALWESKPIIGEGYYSHEELFNDVNGQAGFNLMGGGASAGGVADSFVQYGYLTPFFWFGLGWVAARAYIRGRVGNNPRWLFTYVGFVCASHWLTSQGFVAAFVPGMCFIMVPLVVLPMIRTSLTRVRAGMRNKRMDLKPEQDSIVE